MLAFSAADFEDFLQLRPDLDRDLEPELEAVVRLLAEKGWPFRLHATYNESIERFLNVFEKINRDVPLNGLHWFFDHAETISDKNIERTVALGGGIAVQHCMAFQGEYFVSRYGAAAAQRTPPIRRMLQMGAVVGAGTRHRRDPRSAGVAGDRRGGPVPTVPRAENLASYAGLVPRIIASGGRIRHGGTCRNVQPLSQVGLCGGGHLRDPHQGLSRYAPRTGFTTGLHRARVTVAPIVAVARHLAEASYWVLRKRQPYKVSSAAI